MCIIYLITIVYKITSAIILVILLLVDETAPKRDIYIYQVAVGTSRMKGEGGKENDGKRNYK